MLIVSANVLKKRRAILYTYAAASRRMMGPHSVFIQAAEAYLKKHIFPKWAKARFRVMLKDFDFFFSVLFFFFII